MGASVDATCVCMVDSNNSTIAGNRVEQSEQTNAGKSSTHLRLLSVGLLVLLGLLFDLKGFDIIRVRGGRWVVELVVQLACVCERAGKV